VNGYKLAAYAQIDGNQHGAVAQLHRPVRSGVRRVERAGGAMSQFDAGQPWSVVARKPDRRRHCVPLVGYDSATYTCVTWAKTQPMTPRSTPLFR